MQLDRCPDEVLQLILNELSEPGAFVRANKRLRAFASDAYIRASYLLTRHGRAQALFYALGRHDIVDGRVLEILISSGAQVSRYLVQLAIRHYHHGQVSFIHKPWVRDLPFAVFIHFLALATSHLNADFTVPRKRELDDGELFLAWACGRWRGVDSDSQREKRSQVAQIVGQWKLQPLCAKDPVASNFSITLASEPDLLVLALRNGYRIDMTLRDYVFRQAFIALKGCTSGAKNLSTLRDLCQLQDSLFFLSRTVAAEVLLECTGNAEAYAALSALGREGQLKFDLPTLAVELIKTFAATRSVTDSSLTTSVLRIFSDLPAALANDLDVRHVIFVIVFSSTSTATAAHARFLDLGCTGLDTTGLDMDGTARMTSITAAELARVLASPFISSHRYIVTYAYFYAQFDQETISLMLEKACTESLKLSCKGELLDRLAKSSSAWKDFISNALLHRPRLDVDALPSGEAGARYISPLAQPAFRPCSTDEHETPELGAITQMTLSSSAAYDFVIPPESRWRSHGKRPVLERLPRSVAYLDSQSTQPQNVTLRLEDWVVQMYGPRSAEASALAEHTVTNWINPYVLHWDVQKDEYFWFDGKKRVIGKRRQALSEDVPMTMKHWRILARLGKEPDATFFHRVQDGVPFYEDAEDYLGVTSSPSEVNSPASLSPTAVPVRENIENEEDREAQEQASEVGKGRNRALWVKALGALYREELSAHNDRRKQLGLKRAIRSAFLIALDGQLLDWRQGARDKKARERQQLLRDNPTAYIDVYGDILPDGCSDGEDVGRPAKRRKKD